MDSAVGNSPVFATTQWTVVLRAGGEHSPAADEAVEEQYLRSASTGVTAEQLFERQWALTLLERVIAELHKEFVVAGKATLFDELKVFLTGDKPACGYAQLATRLGTTEAALKMA